MINPTKKKSSRLWPIRFFALTITLPPLLFSLGTIPARSQSVYGVATRRTVVTTGSTTVARRTTVVTTGGHPALCPGCIGALPGGYRAVVVSGTRYYVAGGIYYRPQFYQGRTVYVRVRI
jgi:hypothetical protein